MQPRLPAEQTVQLIIPGTTELSIIGQVVDISRSGMRLLAGCPVEPGSPVHIDLGTSSLSGEVRYCHAGKQGFAIGIQLEHATLSLSNLAYMLR